MPFQTEGQKDKGHSHRKDKITEVHQVDAEQQSKSDGEQVAPATETLFKTM